MAEASEPGNEIIPLNEETQIALPETSYENQLALQQIRPEVVIPAGNFPQANFGPRHETVQDYTNSTIINNYYGAAEDSQGSPSTSNETGARPKQRQKPAIEEDNSNQASLSEPTGKKSSPQRPSSNLSAEHRRSTTQVSAGTQHNSPKKDPSNNASSSQQRGMRPSLPKPTNEDTLTERSGSILHQPSTANIPPSTPDPNNHSNLRQQRVEKSSPKRLAPEKTLTEQFQSALRLPSVSKKAPFKEGIVIFDRTSDHLQLFNPADNTLKQMQSFNEDMKRSGFTAVTLHDFIYVLMEQKSVLRLKYSDERATWERMPYMIDDHGWRPSATVMSGCIHVAGGSYITETNAAEKFDPSSNKWSSLEKKNRVTRVNALVVAQGFIYSIGGWKSAQYLLKEVERFDPVSSTWTFVAPMKQARAGPAAVEFNGKIFVLGGWNGSERISSVEIYDPSTNTWSAMKNNMLKSRSYFSAFVINDDIYAVGGDKEANSIERYSSERDVWEEVQIQTKREIKFRISTKIQI